MSQQVRAGMNKDLSRAMLEIKLQLAGTTDQKSSAPSVAFVAPVPANNFAANARDMEVEGVPLIDHLLGGTHRGCSGNQGGDDCMEVGLMSDEVDRSNVQQRRNR